MTVYERESIMGEYECWNCNEIFELDEPPYDGFEICDECRAEAKENSVYSIEENLPCIQENLG